MAKCRYCGKCEEDAPRDQHNPYCPNQYPVKECRDMAIVDWEEGFNFDGSAPPANIEKRNPVFKLGYLMGHNKIS